jgi:hypothetical protein
MRSLFQGNRITLGTTSELQQSDRAITGTWRVTTSGNDIQGEVRGTLAGFDNDTTFSGHVTWDSETATGVGRCRGQAMFTGRIVAESTMQWTSPDGWDFGGTCSEPPRDVSWSLVRP